MSDVVERLRDYMVRERPLRDEAATEITTLRARIAELEAALEGNVPFDRPLFVPAQETEGRTDDEDMTHVG